MREQTKRRISIAGVVLFCLYLAALVYYLFFAEEYGRSAGTGQLRYNLVPFREIGRFIRYREQLGLWAVLLNVLGNVIGFVPFGAIMPVIHRHLRSAWRTILICMAFSVGVELLQLLTRVGSCDIDDVILNTLGGMLGYACFAVVNRLRKKWYG